MKTSNDSVGNPKETSSQGSDAILDTELKAIAYSMDALIPGFYAWFGSVKIRFP